MPGSQVYGSGNGPTVPLSRRELRKNFPGAQFSPHYQFLDNLAIRDVTMLTQDFLTNITVADFFTVAAGSSATTWAILNSSTVAGADGILRGVCGATAATSGLQLGGTVAYSGDKNCGMECYFRTDTITQKRYEIGFANALPSVNTALVNSLTTPTFNTVTDAAVAVFDKGASTVTSGLYTLNSDGATAVKTAFSPLPVLAVNTYMHVRLEIKTDSAFCWVNGALVASLTGADATGAIEGGTALIPVFMSHLSADTNSANVDVDYIRVWGDRVTQA